YMDYSHGIRFLNNEFFLDGAVKKINQILTDGILYKVLSNEAGAMLQPTYISTATGPLQPKSFGIKSEGTNKIRFIIKEDPAVQSYSVYGSTDGVTFNPPLSVSSNNFTVDNLVPNIVYYIKIKAVNTLGSSVESEVLACKTGAQNPILIVNGFDRASAGNTYNFIRQHASAFNQDSACFNSCTNDAITDGLFNLTDYLMADYILGDESTVDETFSTAEQEKVKLFLQQGGKLLVSGCELAWDLDFKGSASDKDFINNFLKMKYIDDAPNTQSATYYQCTPITPSIFSGVPSFYFDNGTHGTINVKWPDVVKAVNGGEVCLTYNGFDTSYGYAGVYYSGMFNGGTYPGKVVALAVPFETIYPAEIRTDLMIKILSYFDIVLSEESNSITTPADFKLYQNFPNPFNPTTTIKYDVASADFIDITVYDILGKKVAQLVDEYKPAGTYQTIFNASSLSSGIYILELKAGEKFIHRDKMTLLK
ncbi:MAG: T9SS type A sorting domain-containing protein, partial [Ignavibacteriaceae bacterium]|nr:T9SS type A sorting domain-containing protein [Ignavibacteriaceae bacterium]